jgi:hypothetical protein
MSPARDREAWRERAEAFERLLATIDRRATATLVKLDAEVTPRDPARGMDASTAARSTRDQARILAAHFVRFQIGELRRLLHPARPLEWIVLLDALEGAYHVGRLDDDGVLDRWLARQFRAGQAARARAAARAKHENVERELEALAVTVDKIRAAHPKLSRTAIARLVDALHINRTRKRIERLDLARGRDRRPGPIAMLKKS